MRHVFITGASGVVGSELVPLFLGEPETDLHLLLRARSEEHLALRRKDLFEYWGFDENADENCSRIHFYRGDVCQDRFGLEDVTYERLARSLTHIVHSAGDVKLNQPLAAARATAVGGAGRIIRLARECQANGTLQKVDVVSTVGVAGRMPGCVPEDRLTQPRTFRNAYEQAKAEAEELVWREMDGGLPTSIHRPSMVVGDSRTGRIIRYQVFYHICRLLTGVYTKGVLPRLDGLTIDIIPVDYVARGIHATSSAGATSGGVLHLCSGSAGRISLVELARRVHELARESGWRVPEQHFLPRKLVKGLAATLMALAPRGATRQWRPIPFLLEYLEDSQTFDTRRSVGLLSSRHAVHLELPHNVERLLRPFFVGADFAPARRVAET